MNQNQTTIRSANRIKGKSSLCAEHYPSMDLCSQAQMSEESDSILWRMERLRLYANEQQSKRIKPQRRQRSFCF